MRIVDAPLALLLLSVLMYVRYRGEEYDMDMGMLLAL